MDIQIFRCKTCGALLENELSKSQNGVVQCPYCFNYWTVPKKETSPAALSFLRMGEHDLDTCKFDDAYTAFAKAAELDPKEPEAYWGMALAEFKVQYLKDLLESEHNPKGRLQPICHEFTEKKFTNGKNYIRALEFATEGQKKEYARKAQEIDYIRTEFQELKKQGLDYDCFICVKVTDENGEYTRDYNDANDLYFYLKEKGYSPFFSEREIKGATGADYEARILYALYTSECMLIVCNNEEYLQTPWVKNEYTRFNTLIAEETKERYSIAFVFKGTPVERLPGRNGKIEGIDLKKPDAYSRIEEFVSSFTPISLESIPEINRKEYGKTAYTKRDAVRKGVEKRKLNIISGGEITVSERAKLKIVSDFLYHSDFDNAIRFSDSLIKVNPSNSEAYWLQFLAKQNCKDEEAFINGRSVVDDFDDLEKAIASAYEKNRKEAYYQTLASRVKKQKDLESYNEYIVLPDSQESVISELTEIMYDKACAKKDITIFDAIIKTVTDTDKYIAMNLEFAHLIQGKQATKYYKNILDAFEGHHEALYRVWLDKVGSNQAIVFFGGNPENHPAMEKDLYAYGYNEYATKELFQLCLEAVEEKNTDKACILFDFILSMIPQKRNAQFIKFLKDFISCLFKHNKLKPISKYNDLVLSLNKLDDEAYFNKLLLKHNYSNPLSLVNITDSLINDPDYFSAINSYAENYPDDTNLYLDVNESIKSLAVLLKDPQCRDFAIKNVYVPLKEITSCSIQITTALNKEAQLCCTKLLSDYGCQLISELYELRVDVTHNTNLLRGVKFARAAQNSELSAKLEEVIHTQLAAYERNVATDRQIHKASKHTRRKRNFLIFVWIYVILFIVSWILAMAKVPVFFEFFAMLFFMNTGAIYGVGIFLFLVLVVALIGVKKINRNENDIKRYTNVTMCIAFGVCLICVLVGSIYMILAKLEKSSYFVGNGYILRLDIGSETVEVDYYVGAVNSKVEIPSTYGGKTVTSVGTFSFSYINNTTFKNTTLESVIIPDSVTEIGEKAFYYCTSLKSVVIGNGVTTIGSYTFEGCSALSSVTIGSSVTSIGYHAFTYCTSIRNITIPSSVEEINCAFSGCSSLVSVYFKNTSDWHYKYVEYWHDISSSDLSDASVAAKYLRDTYVDLWRRYS